MNGCTEEDSETKDRISFWPELTAASLGLGSMVLLAWIMEHVPQTPELFVPLLGGMILATVGIFAYDILRLWRHAKRG